MDSKINILKRNGGIALASIIMLGSVFLFSGKVLGNNADIVINEIGNYESSGHEWVEIFNKGTEPINMEDWKFWEEATNHGLSLIQGDDYLIGPGEYAVITQNDINFRADYPSVSVTIFDSSWSTLNESGEEIGLKDADGNFVEQFTYVPAFDYSLERKDASLPDYTSSNWIEHPNGNTAGVQNYWSGFTPPANNPPTAIISASATADVNTPVALNGNNSTDSDGTIISYEWKIEDAIIGNEATITHTFTTAGTFAVTLTVTDDDGATDLETLNIVVSDSIPTPTSTPALIVINEFVSDAPEGQNEWIELYNASTLTVNLTGWTLADGVGTISSPTNTIETLGFAVIALASSKLNNSGDIIILKNPTGEIIDKAVYGNWDDGNTADNAPAVSDPNTVARIVDGQDTNNDKNDFAETATPTKGTDNQITAPALPAPPPPAGGGGALLPSFNPGSLVINELVSDPADDAEEFVEIFNTTGSMIALDSWWIEDGSETKTALAGSVAAKGYFVIEEPKGSLNNSGDIVKIFDPSGKEIDSVTYGTWDDGNLADNAPVPADPTSLIRKVNGQDSNNDYYDFVLTATITSGRANIITNTTPEGKTVAPATMPTNVVINELLPNPAGADDDGEWIELKNTGAETINLAGWKLGDSSSKRYTITQGTLSAGGFIVFKRSMTGIALNNTGGDEIALYGASGAVADKIRYTGSAGENESYARRDDNSWAWTVKSTPGTKNILEGKSAAPIIAIDVDTEVAVNEPVMFDASDTTDPDGDEMTFVWDFGDGGGGEGALVEHRFIAMGVYTIKLTVSDTSGNESEKNVIITVKNEADFAGGYLSTEPVEKIRVSEFIPNPAGSDAAEFIELWNPTAEEIDISQLKLDDEEGGSRAYTIPDGTIIAAGEYKVFGKQETKLALNNVSDSVRILYPDGTILTEVRYDDAPEGASYAPDTDENWTWTASITPGEANIISVPKAVAGTKITKNKSKYIKPVINTTLEKIREEDVGDRVKVAGIVAVLPGVLGSQYFYIVGSPGVQIYSYKKDFPSDLKVGDRVEVTGEISQINGEARLKTQTKDDIVKIDHPGEPQAKTLDVTDVGEGYEGWLAQVHGEITEIKSSYMYVDDGTEEVRIYFKRGAGINRQTLQLGDLAQVTGIVSRTKDGFQLLPRGQADIVKTGVAESAINNLPDSGAASSKDVAETYLTATAGGLTALLAGLFARARGAAVAGLVKRFGGVAVAVVRRKK
ncbi:MAG: lamin tail domain-containing protein [Patescibacteria group bacterium]